METPITDVSGSYMLNFIFFRNACATLIDAARLRSINDSSMDMSVTVALSISMSWTKFVSLISTVSDPPFVVPKLGV